MYVFGMVNEMQTASHSTVAQYHIQRLELHKKLRTMPSRRLQTDSLACQSAC